MNTSPPDDPRLLARVRDARTASDLPPGFQNAAWRRIEQADSQPANLFGRLDELVAWLLRPRHALVVATGGRRSGRNARPACFDIFRK